MSITSKFLKGVMAEARPIIERQMNDAKLIAGFRDVVAGAGGDWGALKALIKAHIEDENDEAGDGKRVNKILEKADCSTAYADMLGLANMNEKNFSAGSYAEASGSSSGRTSDFGSDNGGSNPSPETIDADTGEITEQPETATQSADMAVGLAGPALAGSRPAANTKPAPHSPSPVAAPAQVTISELQRPAILAGADGHPSIPTDDARGAGLGVVTPPSESPQSSEAVAHFDNPRCQQPDRCTFAHSRNSCFDCTMAWAKRPREEQVKMWSQATQAA